MGLRCSIGAADIVTRGQMVRQHRPTLAGDPSVSNTGPCDGNVARPPRDEASRR